MLTARKLMPKHPDCPHDECRMPTACFLSNNTKNKCCSLSAEWRITDPDTDEGEIEDAAVPEDRVADDL